jgi:hypothetical protein
MYDVVKPATSYRKIYSTSEELVELAYQVSRVHGKGAGSSTQQGQLLWQQWPVLLQREPSRSCRDTWMADHAT